MSCPASRTLVAEVTALGLNQSFVLSDDRGFAAVRRHRLGPSGPADWQGAVMGEEPSVLAGQAKRRAALRDGPSPSGPRRLRPGRSPLRCLRVATGVDEDRIRALCGATWANSRDLSDSTPDQVLQRRVR